jgi:hypothetical protein
MDETAAPPAAADGHGNFAGADAGPGTGLKSFPGTAFFVSPLLGRTWPECGGRYTPTSPASALRSVSWSAKSSGPVRRARTKSSRSRRRDGWLARTDRKRRSQIYKSCGLP